MYYGIDFGTTNTVVAHWKEDDRIPSLMGFGDICRAPLEGSKGIEVQFTIPSAVYLKDKLSWKDKLGQWGPLMKNWFLGSEGVVGQRAIDKDNHAFHDQFVTNFKPNLLKAPHTIVSSRGNRPVSSNEVMEIFMREIFRSIDKKTGERPRSLAISVPVDSFEPYRAAMVNMARELGIKHLHLVDEPVAAAMGYGLGLDEEQTVLVVDFGGGTLDLAVVQLNPDIKETGRCEVMAKAGAPVGGNLIDNWIAKEFAEKLGFELALVGKNEEVDWWYRVLLEEARRIKEALFFKEEVVFYLTAPEHVLSFEKRLYAQNNRLQSSHTWTKQDLTDLLEKNGLTRILDSLTHQALNDAGKSTLDIDYVLMVGGSTLLPGVYPFFSDLFSRKKVQAWQPFNAVAYGACAFGNKAFIQSDYIVHSYAIKTYDKKTHNPEFKIIVPQGTKYPTKRNFWKKRFIPTCSMGEPETIFKLVICELATAKGANQEFFWDERGDLKILKQGEEVDPLVVSLNEDDPVMGTLNPAHQPNDRSPRLEINFYINEDRWLCTDVYDLKTNSFLFKEKAVIKLL
jgi:molecular chaperone DnaK (HSP70)